jgi:hypothetical protein
VYYIHVKYVIKFTVVKYQRTGLEKKETGKTTTRTNQIEKNKKKERKEGYIRTKKYRKGKYEI